MITIVKRPDEDPEILVLDGSLESLQRAVGGHIEHIGFGGGIGLLVDEDGRAKELSPNFALNDYCDIVGNVLFVDDSGEDFDGLSEQQVSLVMDCFAGSAVSAEKRRQVIEKGRRWLGSYLGSRAGDMSAHSKRRLFRVLGDKYRECMTGDAGLFSQVETFVSGRRTSAEKEEFFYGLVSYLVRCGNIKETYMKRYPDDFDPE